MKKKIILGLTLSFMALSLVACNQKAAKSVDESEAGVEEEASPYTTVVLDDFTGTPQLDPVKTGDSVAVFHTNHGDIKVRLFPEYAPKAVENFVTHAQEGYYNGVTFHRVINQFMIQGGDPNGNGTGGESIWGAPFENEVSLDLRNIRGALCMANAGPDTNGSQFYIVQNTEGEKKTSALNNADKNAPFISGNTIYENKEGKTLTFGDIFPQQVIDAYSSGGVPDLDLGYTVFGQVYEGITIVDEIAAVETLNDNPVDPVIITSVEVGTY